ncbi:MAG: NAD-dependent epimerase/dehydratase family protein [Deltaproteobacteria bacterium]|nr:NAD-dependent epimerase/dehydratase family protein [Deltaproteobacteria bacterium]
MPEVLLTGATGLLGNAIARALVEQQRSVRALVRSPHKAASLVPSQCELVPGDVTDRASVTAAMRDCRVVVHAAGLPEQWLADDATFERVNVGGTRNIVEAALECGVERFVYTSTIDVFRFGAPGDSFDESELDQQPKATAYERSKQDADRVVTAALERGLDAVFLHPSGIYGAGPDTSPGTNHLIADLARGKVPLLLPGGMPVVHADDAATGHLLAERDGAKGSRYILSESYQSLRDVAQQVRAATKTSKVPAVMPLFVATALAGVGELVAGVTRKPPLLPKGQLHFLQTRANPSGARARRELGWKPRLFAQGLEQTLAFLRSAGRL